MGFKVIGLYLQNEFKKARDNKVANVLFKKLEDEEEVIKAMISFPTLVWVEELKQIYKLFEEMQNIMSLL